MTRELNWYGRKHLFNVKAVMEELRDNEDMIYRKKTAN
jgi:hypothetical protein